MRPSLPCPPSRTLCPSRSLLVVLPAVCSIYQHHQSNLQMTVPYRLQRCALLVNLHFCATLVLMWGPLSRRLRLSIPSFWRFFVSWYSESAYVCSSVGKIELQSSYWRNNPQTPRQSQQGKITSGLRSNSINFVLLRALSRTSATSIRRPNVYLAWTTGRWGHRKDRVLLLFY
jgi:hypothetical protein